MNLSIERIGSLLEFAEQSAKLRSSPPRTIAQYKGFNRFEDQMRGLPGLQLGSKGDDDSEAWLQLERLVEIKPHMPENPMLVAWIDLPSTPEKEPSLKASVALNELVAIGVIDPAILLKPEKGETPERRIQLDEFPSRDELELSFKAYRDVVWKKWSTEEKERRKSIKLYSNLFTLFQQIQGNLVDTQLELVWGIGMAVCSDSDGEIKYPLITQLVEITLNEGDMSLEICPRGINPRLEIQAFEARDNHAVVRLGEAAKQFFEGIENAVNPFEPSTYESVLRSASTLLDGQGVYWPDQTTADDRSIPTSQDHLTITDTWVLFARPRSSSQFIQDLQRFGTKLDESLELPPALAAIVTEPSSVREEEILPPFRGMSFVEGCGEASPSSLGKAQELYFPLPYNDEQVQIIQRLEVHDGVVVQGPPGTGKTHTIANVICHYLALGKRVLVTSMKDPALSVLRNKIPEEIRPLAISLLTSEAEGMKQFEFAINKIAWEIQQIDRSAYKREIAHIEGQIEELHATIARADREIAEWANKNIEPFTMDGDSFRPEAAAKLVSGNQGEFDWLLDPITIAEIHHPQIKDTDVIHLRAARLAVGDDLVYMGKRIPLVTAFPETQKLIQAHQYLLHSEELKRKEDEGLVPRLLNSDQTTLISAIQVINKLSELLKIHDELKEVDDLWIDKLVTYLRKQRDTELVGYLTDLITEIETSLSARNKFLTRPVSIPQGIDQDDTLIEAVTNLTVGKSPFGIAGLLGKQEQKRTLSNIKIIGSPPKSPEDWEHALDFIRLLKNDRTLLARWNAIAGEIPLPTFDASPESILQAGQAISLYELIIKYLDKESAIMRELSAILPTWSDVVRIPQNSDLLNKAKDILSHHLTRYRLDQTQVIKEAFLKALSGCEGEITQRIRGLLDNILGKQGVSTSDIQSKWSTLMGDLHALHEKTSHLRSIDRITGAIEASGAPQWAKQLRTQVRQEPYDELLPDNWANAWKLKRLSTHLQSIDSRAELKRLFDLRSTSENDLARAYKGVVGKRAWLKISENATPSVRSALEAYRTAIQRIGRGTGVRAARYRHDARGAADQANIAVPCWIMPHYRVSESLPSNFGLFDLVIIDEASQSDLTALPSILRAKKVLIVGDDQQVSPEGVGVPEDRIRNIMPRYLSNQVGIYFPQFAPDRSIYDLFKVVFAKSSVMLREHFRCVAPIIEYSRRKFYNGELKPLRLPKASERLDPPLIDLYVMDGYRDDKKNPAEAHFIVDEISRIVGDPAFAHRSIGVVSLLGTEQALLIMEQLNEKLGEEVITRHEIACGDARTFQGKERDIIFLSMVVVSGNAHAQTRGAFAQRFNVAASRARDRMYLVRSIDLEDLSPADTLRTGLIQHFQTPFTQAPKEVEDLRELCESPFEREVFDVLTRLGYRVTPQVPVGAYRIDMVVEGDNDHRLAIECDGDQYHGPEKWDADMRRQRILERAGWRFWRSFASTFVMRRDEVIQDLVDTLSNHGIRPTASGTGYVSIHVESRRVSAFKPELSAQQMAPEISDAPDLTEIVQDDFELVPQEASSLKPMKLEKEALRLNTPPREGS